MAKRSLLSGWKLWRVVGFIQGGIVMLVVGGGFLTLLHMLISGICRNRPRPCAGWQDEFALMLDRVFWGVVVGGCLMSFGLAFVVYGALGFPALLRDYVQRRRNA